jgi:homogentisate 1,2-dioxygenase
MPYYHKQGTIPAKRHTQFRKPNGQLYQEELVSTEGFQACIHWFTIPIRQPW